jgi:hypothetical protein
MRCLWLSALLLCAAGAFAAEISGPIYFKGKLTENVQAGYVALVEKGDQINNMAGMTPTGDSGHVWCDTYKPRRTGLKWHKQTGLTFQHINIPPGKYLLYVRYGEHYLDWKVVDVPKATSKLTASLAISPSTFGTLHLVIGRGTGDYNIQLTPLTAKKQSPLPGAKIDFGGPVIDVDVQGSETTLRGVKEGVYRVTLRAAHRQGTEETGIFTTYDDLGSWTITVKAGKALQFRLP